MFKNWISTLSVFFLLLIFACNKTEEVIVPNNQAPPDSTISNITIETYVNKAYIAILGREPSETEKSDAIANLKTNNLSMQSRKDFIDAILSQPEYFDHLYETQAQDLLNNFDTNQIAENIAILTLLLNNPDYSEFYDEIQYEIERLEAMQEIPSLLHSGQLTIPELHFRLINNTFYDQINMGSENFVRATFENFLFRYPTNVELENGVTMVDGFEAVLFYESGDSKIDFMNIFLASDNYFEGQVRYLYQKFLFREPDTEEMAQYSSSYQSDHDYKELQKNILTLDEYVGL